VSNELNKVWNPIVKSTHHTVRVNADRFTKTHSRSVTEVEAGESAQPSAFTLLVKPALRRELLCVRKQTLIATNSVQIRLAV